MWVIYCVLRVYTFHVICSARAASSLSKGSTSVHTAACCDASAPVQSYENRRLSFNGRTALKRDQIQVAAAKSYSIWNTQTQKLRSISQNTPTGSLQCEEVVMRCTHGSQFPAFFHLTSQTKACKSMRIEVCKNYIVA